MTSKLTEFSVDYGHQPLNYTTVRSVLRNLTLRSGFTKIYPKNVLSHLISQKAQRKLNYESGSTQSQPHRTVSRQTNLWERFYANSLMRAVLGKLTYESGSTQTHLRKRFYTISPSQVGSSQSHPHRPVKGKLTYESGSKQTHLWERFYPKSPTKGVLHNLILTVRF